MEIIRNNAEFGVELCLSVPYAYWLHKNNKLKKVITSKGMKPFYYFCDDVSEEFEYRTIDNAAAGLNDLPNNWIHHNSLAVTGREHSELTDKEKIEINGVLDYSKWELPPYKEYYKNDEFNYGKTVMILNKYNFEHNHKPYGYFDFECLIDMFVHFRNKGYTVIYKRPTNREIGVTVDNNEMNSINNNLNLEADVEGVGVINDHELTNHFDNVILFDDIVKNNQQYTYNEIQLKVMSNVDSFITQCGGNAILACCWGVPVITYVTQGAELRPNYFNKQSYWFKLSNSDVTPVFDAISDDKENDYRELLKTIKTKII
jgi:hypothetical protein